MKILKLTAVLLLSLLWIFITNYKMFPINNLGSLLTYKSGVLGMNNKAEIKSEVKANKELTIKIDSFGIPYIYADKDQDLAFGLGYMHAKDRYFQMELMSKMVLGELSSRIGKNGIRSDKFWKPYEFSRKSKEILEEYKINNPTLYTYIVNYSVGVNAYLENNQIDDPLYKIFNLKTQEWKPEYCLLISWYMSRNLAYFDYHIERQQLLDNLPKDILGILYPQNFEKLKTILPSTITAVSPIENEHVEEIGEYGNTISTSPFNTDIGSNNWAVNSEKAKGNGALIANDPHLFLTLPGAFYEASLSSDNIKAYGFTIPGVPLIVSGHNTNISWGVTNGEWDLTDRYLLKTKNDSLYFYEGNWIPFEEEQYHINVRGEGKEELNIKRTVHGPVKKDGDTYYAQKWYPSGKNYSINALFNVMKSNTYDEFKNALKTYDYPPQNFIYADVNDNIGIVCAGKLPKRPNGFEGGLLDGTKAPLKEDFYATQFETSNPEQNYLFSANQLPIQNGHYFGAHWHKDDYRVSHIDSLLKRKDDWDIQDIKIMHSDEVDMSFFHVKDIFKEYSFEDEHAYILDLLSTWNGDMDSDSKNAYIYEILRLSIQEEAERFAKDKLNVKQVPSMKSFLDYVGQDSIQSEEFGSKKDLLDHIVENVDSVITVENKIEKKNYSHLSKINVYNISFLPGFGYQISDAGGNKNTINMNASAHPVFRSIYEMKKDNIKGYTIIAGGQSGKLNSKNYLDQINDWKEGNYKTTQFTANPENLKNIINTINFK